jgi:chromosome segregation ATPase
MPIMNRENSDFDDISIVPERDELVSHRNQKRGSSLTASDVIPRPTGPGRLSGASKFAFLVLFLGLFVSVGGAWYFYDQGLQTIDALDRANSRLLQLENRLNLVDEAAEQSSVGLLERVDFNFSEIDKLWAARNVLRNDVGTINATLGNQADSINKIETAVAAQASMNNQQSALLDQNAQLFETIQNRVNQLNTSISGLNNLNISQQLNSITRDLDTLKSSMALEDSGLADRVNINEQDIESINLYRLSLNQTINAIQQSLNELEERVAGMTTSSTAF